MNLVTHDAQRSAAAASNKMRRDGAVSRTLVASGGSNAAVRPCSNRLYSSSYRGTLE